MGYDNPDIYIMLQDLEPNSTLYNVSCRFFGEDVCVISGKELKEFNTTRITVGVSCVEDCKYKLQAELEAEINLKPANKMHKIFFHKD